jgi:hypothetical protein
MASVPTFYSYRRSFTVHLRERGSTLFAAASLITDQKAS